MNSKVAARRRPVWPMLVVGSFILLVVVGLVIVALRDLPAPADPKIVEEPFAEHIAFLKELALACPEAVTPPSTDSGGEFDRAAWDKYNALWDGWSEKSKSRPDLLAHPALKGASSYVKSTSEGFRAYITLIDHEGLEQSWLESAWGSVSGDSTKTDVERPLVRQWHEDGMHLVRYERRFVNPDGVTMGLQLLVDLNLVAQNISSD